MLASTPAMPATSPWSGARPLSTPTMDIPSSPSMNSSGEPTESTSGRMMGMASSNATAPKMPPIMEAL